MVGRGGFELRELGKRAGKGNGMEGRGRWFHVFGSIPIGKFFFYPPGFFSFFHFTVTIDSVRSC